MFTKMEKEKLNPPSHFISNPTRLLPPSSFHIPSAASIAAASAAAAPAAAAPVAVDATTTVPDPWKVLMETATEILHLHEETNKLKESLAVSQLPSRPVAQPPTILDHPLHDGKRSTSDDWAAYDSVIRRQSTEIEKLNSQLQQAEIKNEKHISSLQNELAMNQSNYSQQLAATSEQIEILRRTHDIEMKLLLKEKESLQSEFLQAKLEWQERLRLQEEMKQTEVTELEQQLIQIKTSAGYQEAKLQEKIMECEKMMEEQKQSLIQMKMYLSQSETAIKSSETWRKEKSELKNHLQAVEDQNRSIVAEKDLLVTRLAALNDILAIQELQISRVGNDALANKKCLLMRWREKVYELLLQLKCNELSSADEKRNWCNKVTKLEDECSGLQGRIGILTHSLHEKQAALEILSGKIESLKLEKKSFEDQLAEKDQQCGSCLSSLDLLKESVELTMEKYCIMESTIHEKLEGSLTFLSNRIGFASGRVELLQAQFARKEALLIAELTERRKDEVIPEEPMSNAFNNNALTELACELKHVMEERDQLVAQIKSDAARMQDRISSATKQANDEAKELQQRLTDIQTHMESKSQKVEELSCLLEVAHSELAHAQEELELLKTELAKTQIHASNDLESQRVSDQQTFLEQLNEIRREHTKAVVRVRQLERQAERDHEKSEGELKSIKAGHQEDMDRLSEKLRVTEKDNNILMATLRQEGLLGKVRRQRQSPFGAAPESENEAAVNPHSIEPKTSSVAVRSRSTTPSHTDDQLDCVIDELKELTSQVLAEDDYS